jgi:hypothetical protein
MSPWNRQGQPRRLAGAAVLAAVLLAVAGCKIVSVSGPTSAMVGQLLTYQVDLLHDEPDLSDVTIWLMVEIPDAWSFVGADYVATVGGMPSNGAAIPGTPPSPPESVCFTDEPQVGYKRVFVSAGSFDLQTGDEATANVHLLPAGDPGDFTLRFQAAAESGPALVCQLQGPDDALMPVNVPYDVRLAASVLVIPTLGPWGAALLALLLVGLALRRLR